MFVFGENRKLKRGWIPFAVEDIVHETPDTVTLVLKDSETNDPKPFDYLPGQYVTFRFDHMTEKPIVRSYTLSSSPTFSSYIEFTVKEVENGFVSLYLCRDIKKGDILRGRGPIGKFCFDPVNDKKKLALIGAGSGVTPFLSIAKEFVALKKHVKYDEKTSPMELNLLFSFRTKADIIAKELISELSKISGINVTLTLTREKEISEKMLFGRIDDQILKKWTEGWNLHDYTFMTCGPDEMMETVQKYFLARDVPPNQFKMESFSN